MNPLQYPIGKFEMPEFMSLDLLKSWVVTIEVFPDMIKKATNHLAEDQIDTPYREDGWTIRQVVHHVADSHMNAYIRFKLAITEDKPVIKPYKQGLWALYPDANEMEIDASVMIIEGVHDRWVALMKTLDRKDWKRVYVHPEYNREIALDEAAGQYAWHCKHHLAHINGLKERMGW